VPSYTRDQFLGDLMRLTEGLSDPDLADVLIRGSRPTVVWMRRHGVRWILMMARQSYHVGGKHRFWGGLNVEAVGGGPGLIQALYDGAERLGVAVSYGTKATGLRLDERGAIRGIACRGADGFFEVATRAVVLASGGFEANPEWRTRYLGPGWELAHVRGTRHNTGDGIRMGLALGASRAGDWNGMHAEPIDARAGNSAPVVLVYPYGVVVDRSGRRFFDEGGDLVHETWEWFARDLHFKAPGSIAYAILDSRLTEIADWQRAIRSEIAPFRADTLAGLAQLIGVDAVQLAATVAVYNAACTGDPGPLRLRRRIEERFV